MDEPDWQRMIDRSWDELRTLLVDLHPIQQASLLEQLVKVTRLALYPPRGDRPPFSHPRPPSRD
jgi:hypothetical protein